MDLFNRLRPSFFKKLVNKVPLPREYPHSLACLNIAQFGGVLNDNIFKFILIYFLIDTLGVVNANTILSATGALFVIPFLLFSSAAGILADRYSKQRLLVIMKICEMAIMLLALFTFGVKNVWGCYTLLFLLASHSAIFGPAKYGIIAELVSKDNVSKANGLITSFTYLGIILGTFLASFLTEVTNKSYLLILGFCFLIAALGFWGAFGIKRTTPQGSKKKINPLFFYEIYQTLSFCRQRKHLLLSIFGSAYFLFIGGYTQLNIIPYAIQTLHLSEVWGGYLFLSTALGIALGAYLGGKASKLRVELGVSCLSGFLIALFLITIGVFVRDLWHLMAVLMLLGIFGGLFIVPFDSFTQLNSSDEQRGQVIAAANFLSFCGVLIASIAIYVFGSILGFSAAGGFTSIGIITFFVSIYYTLSLSDLSLPFFAKQILNPLFRMQTGDLSLIDKNPSSLLVLKNATALKSLFLLGTLPTLHLAISKPRSSFKAFFLNCFYSIHPIVLDENMQNLKELQERLGKEEVPLCFLVEKEFATEAFRTKGIFDAFFKGKPDILYVSIERIDGRRTIVCSKESR